MVSNACPIKNLTDVTATHAIDPLLTNRYLVLVGDLAGQQVYIHVVYAPVNSSVHHQNRVAFFNSLPRTFPSNSMHIVCGDFNSTLDPSLDELHPSSRFSHSRPELLLWLSELELVDVWRHTHPSATVFSNPMHTNRLDYVFISSTAVHTLTTTVRYHVDRYGLYFHSDHAPVEFFISVPHYTPRRPPPWRCPPWLLQLQHVRDHLAFTLHSLVISLHAPSEPSFNPARMFDDHVYHDRAYLESMAKIHTLEDARHTASLRAQCAACATAHAASPSSLTLSALEAAELTLKDHIAALRHRNSQSRFDTEISTGETCSRHFFRPPTSKARTSAFPVSNAAEFDRSASTCRSYWASIFHSSTPDTHAPSQAPDFPLLTSILAHTKARLTQAQSSHLDAPLTAHDFATAIIKAPRNRASGPDGLPYEYYKLNPHLWAKFLVVLYDFNHSRGHMSHSQSSALLCLLYKSGDPSNPSNYRPLTLLNTSAKFGPAILGRRTNAILGDLLHEDQYGFTPKRAIQHALTRFHSLQQYCRHHQLHAAGAVMCDFAKAFDSVNRVALDLTLQHFGFGTRYRSMSATFFTNTSVSILFNNSPLAPFTLGSGVRQGDPFSPALFVLFIEPLLNYLRHAMTTMGILTPPVCHTVIAFADDVTGLLTDLKDASTFLRHVDTFCSATGMSLNLGKTIVMPFGPSLPLETHTTLLELQGPKLLAPSDTCRWLGIRQGPALDDSYRYVGLPALILLRCTLWQYRARTIRGRVLLLRTIILPVLWYTMAVCHIPTTILATITKLAEQFISGKHTSSGLIRNHLPRTWHHVPTSSGGLNIPHLVHMRQAYGVRCITSVLLSQGSHLAPLAWIAPALHLFTAALDGRGYGLDIMYLRFPTATSRRSGPLLATLGRFWYYALQAWSHKFLPFHCPNQDVNTTLTAPLWLAPRFSFGANLTQLYDSSNCSDLFVTAHLLCLRDIVVYFSGWPTEDALTAFLAPQPPRPSSPVLSRPSARLSARAFLRKLSPLLPPLPSQLLVTLGSRSCHVASHDWTFFWPTGTLHSLDTISLGAIYKSLHTAVIPDLPLTQLSVSSTPAPSTWVLEHRLDRFVLPVYRDFKFRLQHNALGFLYKYAWRTDVVQPLYCPLCEGPLETPIHLLWTCPLVLPLWTPWLLPFASLLSHAITWRHIVFLDMLTVADTVPMPQQALVPIVFNIVRCLMLRSIWLHRNEILYSPSIQFNAFKIQIPVHVYFRLHWRSLHQHFSTAVLTPLSEFFSVQLSDDSSLSPPTPELGPSHNSICPEPQQPPNLRATEAGGADTGLDGSLLLPSALSSVPNALVACSTMHLPTTYPPSANVPAAVSASLPLSAPTDHVFGPVLVPTSHPAQAYTQKRAWALFRRRGHPHATARDTAAGHIVSGSVFLSLSNAPVHPVLSANTSLPPPTSPQTNSFMNSPTTNMPCSVPRRPPAKRASPLTSANPSTFKRLRFTSPPLLSFVDATMASFNEDMNAFAFDTMPPSPALLNQAPSPSTPSVLVASPFTAASEATQNDHLVDAISADESDDDSAPNLTPIAFPDAASTFASSNDFLPTSGLTDDSDGHVRRNVRDIINRKGTHGRYKYHVHWDETFPGEPSHSWVPRHQMNGALFLIGIVDRWKLYLDSKPIHPLSFLEYRENDVPSNQVGANGDMDCLFQAIKVAARLHRRHLTYTPTELDAFYRSHNLQPGVGIPPNLSRSYIEFFSHHGLNIDMTVFAAKCPIGPTAKNPTTNIFNGINASQAGIYLVYSVNSRFSHAFIAHHIPNRPLCIYDSPNYDDDPVLISKYQAYGKIQSMHLLQRTPGGIKHAWPAATAP